MSPVFENMSNSTNGIQFFKVNIDDEDAISGEIGVRSVRIAVSLYIFVRVRLRCGWRRSPCSWRFNMVARSINLLGLALPAWRYVHAALLCCLVGDADRL